jgi:restriction system protein
MARRKQSILNELVKFPWWVSAGLAGLVYFLSVFVLPGITLSSPVLRNLPAGLARVGPLLSMVLLGVAAVSAFFQFRKGQLLERQTGLDSVGELDWRQFEGLVSEAFRRKGFIVIDNIEDGPDGGVDLRLRKNGQVVFVQCKHWKARSVGVKVVRELYGVMAVKSVKHGIVVTHGEFTSEAREFSKSNSITLIDGPTLTQMISSVQQSGNIKVQPEAARACPKCGSKMVIRAAKKGPHAGKKFWGCSKYPECKSLISTGTE